MHRRDGHAIFSYTLPVADHQDAVTSNYPNGRRPAMTQLPHAFKRILLNLARSKEFPSGSTLHGYEFVAPLDAAGHIDPVLWQKHRENCGVRRFWDGEQDQHGRLVHKPGGAEHSRWVFDYDGTAAEDEEAGYRFGTHVFSLGEYVTVRD